MRRKAKKIWGRSVIDFHKWAVSSVVNLGTLAQLAVSQRCALSVIRRITQWRVALSGRRIRTRCSTMEVQIRA
jgi:hypothetical protein